MSKQNLGYERGPGDIDHQGGMGHPGYSSVPFNEHRGINSGKMTFRNSDLRDALELTKYLFFTFNLFFWLCSCAVLGVAIWIAVDRSFMATITGDPLYAVAAYIMIAGGAIMFILAFLGCCGAIIQNKTMLWVYFAVLALILFLLFIGAILAIVFRSQIGDAVQDTMEDTLVNYYGIDRYKRKNKAITDAWDKAQERLDCCGVSYNLKSDNPGERGWHIYRKTEWFKKYGPNPNLIGAEDKKPYVPKSCCVRDRFHRYVNTETCQEWDLGPPKQKSGAINRALYYEGCYEAGLRYLQENSDILIGIGIGFLFVVICGLLISWVLIHKLKDDKPK